MQQIIEYRCIIIKIILREIDKLLDCALVKYINNYLFIYYVFHYIVYLYYYVSHYQ